MYGFKHYIKTGNSKSKGICITCFFQSIQSFTRSNPYQKRGIYTFLSWKEKMDLYKKTNTWTKQKQNKSLLALQLRVETGEIMEQRNPFRVIPSNNTKEKRVKGNCLLMKKIVEWSIC